MENKWSLRYDKCKGCGTTSVEHRARGLCVDCYNEYNNLKNRGKRSKRGSVDVIMTESYIKDRYVSKGMSQIDIAKECGCSRQFVNKKMKQYGVVGRTKSSARKSALDAGKLKFERATNGNEPRIVTLQKQTVRKGFFSNWSQEMAYVLGVIYTDGCMLLGKNRDPNTRNNSTTSAFSIAQKEPEILEKVLKLMECNAKLYHRARKSYSSTTSGDIFYFTLYNDDIYDDLIRIGLTPNKSKTIEFPQIPKEYLMHFIRGCWDGDGSVYLDGKRLSASYITGSIRFAEGMLKALLEAGFAKRTLYSLHRKSISYYFRFTGSQCIKLYHYMYDGVPESQYLKRKYDMFK
jgi:hypothetical protein